MNMQSLMSETSRCSDLLKCAYNLSEMEIKVYRKLTEEGPLRADQVSLELDRNPSSVYRSLQKLMSCGMVFRETENLEGGGYYHVYIARDRDSVKKDLESCVGRWKERVDDLMRLFDSEMWDEGE